MPRVKAGLSFLSQDLPHPLVERWKIVLDHVPNDFQVDAKVLMHDDISKSGGQSPHLSRVFRPEVRRQRTASLAYDHQVMHNPGLKKILTCQSLGCASLDDHRRGLPCV